MFEPYTKQTYDATQWWVEERGIFDAIGAGVYEEAVVLAR